VEFDHVRFTLKADIAGHRRQVRFVPKADIELVFERAYSRAALTATDRLAHLSWKESMIC
jgi:hypothetical protein